MTTVRVYGGKSSMTAPAPSPLLSGLLAGIALIVVWVILVYVTHNGVGLVAWGVGGLLGIVIAKAAKPPTKATGALAAVLTLVTVVVAHAVGVVGALQPLMRQELANDPAALIMLFIMGNTERQSFSTDLQATIDARPDLVADTTFFGPGHELRSRMIDEAAGAATASPFTEQRLLVSL